ncbi:MAG: cytochrome c [Burkholderiaceae bacterium]|jgi:mono/diheme cytochrome c family protein|nr:cytochrome c [Burkholderiaceae bacterium]
MKTSRTPLFSIRRAPLMLCVSTLLAFGSASTSVWSQDATPATDEPVPAFTAAVMADPASIESGKQVWDGQCRHCHGNSAYPGKAPKLKPSSYQPDFVYDRVTNGFRKMPGWKAVFNQQQRIGVTAFIMSEGFSP